MVVPRKSRPLPLEARPSPQGPSLNPLHLGHRRRKHRQLHILQGLETWFRLANQVHLVQAPSIQETGCSLDFFVRPGFPVVPAKFGERVPCEFEDGVAVHGGEAAVDPDSVGTITPANSGQIVIECSDTSWGIVDSVHFGEVNCIDGDYGLSVPFLVTHL